jgi:transcriptional regulator with XRE-family HTH domain
MAAWALVREARARAGLSQRELATRAGKAQSEIARIEGGRQDPTFATLLRLLRAAGFDLDAHLIPHDAHDEGLIEAMLALTPEERLAALEAEVELLAAVTEAAPVER